LDEAFPIARESLPVASAFVGCAIKYFGGEPTQHARDTAELINLVLGLAAHDETEATSERESTAGAAG
jgi:hypothetical protein